MKISYRTKEESNKAQEEDFLALAPMERLYVFFKMISSENKLPVLNEPEPSKNFILEKQSDR